MQNVTVFVGTVNKRQGNSPNAKRCMVGRLEYAATHLTGAELKNTSLKA
jgi:hypothetical protein